MAKPGIMFYFDVRPCLKRLTNEEKGMLFEAILDYGQHGILPDFDGMMGIAWDFIQPRIDADDDHYKEVVQARKTAARARWNKEAMQMHSDDAKADFAVQVMPTTTSLPKQPQNQLSTASSMSARGGLEGGEVKTVSDELKQAALSKFDQYLFEKRQQKGVDRDDC